MPNVSIIGLGYIGLPTAILLAKHKMRVYGVDVQQSVVDKVNAAKEHTLEHGLQVLLQETVHSGYLTAHTQVKAAEIFIITVPTPITAKRKPNLDYIKAAAKAIAPKLTKGNLVILESTSPVGTTEKLEQWLMNLRPDLTFPQKASDGADIQLAYCPERVLPGNILYELVHNERVIGGLTPTATHLAKELYQVFVKGNLHTAPVRTAEMLKLTENAFRDVNIAFANEIDRICHEFSIDSSELINLANKHPRVNILQPGCGVGGHCIPVDPWFIVDSAPNEAELIRCARMVNDGRPQWVVEQIQHKAQEILAKKPHRTMGDIKIACLGLSYKANSDDLRNSPAIEIIQNIAKLGYQVLVVSEYTKKLPFVAHNVRLCALETALSADIICMLMKDSSFVQAKECIEKHENVLDFS